MFTLNNYPIEYIIICPAGDMRILLYYQFDFQGKKRMGIKGRRRASTGFYSSGDKRACGGCSRGLSF